MTSDEIIEILNLDLPRYKHNDPPPSHPCTDVRRQTLGYSSIESG